MLLLCRHRAEFVTLLFIPWQQTIINLRYGLWSRINKENTAFQKGEFLLIYNDLQHPQTLSPHSTPRYLWIYSIGFSAFLLNYHVKYIVKSRKVISSLVCACILEMHKPLYTLKCVPVHKHLHSFPSEKMGSKGGQSKKKWLEYLIQALAALIFTGFCLAVLAFLSGFLLFIRERVKNRKACIFVLWKKNPLFYLVSFQCFIKSHCSSPKASFSNLWNR